MHHQDDRCDACLAYKIEDDDQGHIQGAVAENRQELQQCCHAGDHKGIWNAEKAENDGGKGQNEDGIQDLHAQIAAHGFEG